MRVDEVKNSQEIQDKIIPLRKHPALLELRTMAIYDELYRAYGREMADRLMQSWCVVFDCDYAIINEMLDSKHRIQLNKIYNLPQYRRMMLIMGYAWNENKQYIIDHYLGKNRQVLYRGGYNTLSFFTDRWIEGLQYSVCVLKDDKQVAQVYNLLANLQILFKLFA